MLGPHAEPRDNPAMTALRRHRTRIGIVSLALMGAGLLTTGPVTSSYAS